MAPSTGPSDARSPAARPASPSVHLGHGVGEVVLLLVVTYSVRSASTEVSTEARGARSAPIAKAPAEVEHAPPSQFALDKMTEALLWASDDGEQFEFVRQDIQRVMRCAPVAWLHEKVDRASPAAVEAFRDEHRRFVERFDSARRFFLGEAKRPGNRHQVERMSIAWRCAA